MHQGQVFGIKWIKIVMLSIPLFLLDTSQEHSLPVQVFVNKSGESKEKPASPPVLPQASSPPVMCSTPKTGLQLPTSTSTKFTASSQDDEKMKFSPLMMKPKAVHQSCQQWQLLKTIHQKRTITQVYYMPEKSTVICEFQRSFLKLCKMNNKIVSSYRL